MMMVRLGADWTWNIQITRLSWPLYMLVKKALDALKYFIIKPYLRNPSGFYPGFVRSLVFALSLVLCVAPLYVLAATTCCPFAEQCVCVVFLLLITYTQQNKSGPDI